MNSALKNMGFMLCVCGLHSAATAQTVAVDFGGDYRDGNQNAASTLTYGTGDYDFDGTADDRRGYRAIDSAFVAVTVTNPAIIAGTKSTNFYAGFQLANFNSAADPGVSPNYKYSGSGDSLQATSSAGTTNMGMVFAPYVKKADFLNGQSAVSNLRFADAGGSVTFRINQFTLGKTARALVKNGSSWYVSAAQITTVTNLSVNGYAETWYACNTSSNLFLNTNSLGAGVSGSTLTDIQAFGVLAQALNFNGTAANEANFQIGSFSATLSAGPAQPYYLLTVNSGSGSGSYTNGAQVAIAAGAPPLTGMNFARWTGDTRVVDSVTSANATVTMSTNAVTLTATYALTPQTIDAVLAQTTNRQAQALALQVTNPYPPTGLWFHEDFALAAYWQNTSNTAADAGLMACVTNGLYAESIAAEDFHWHAYLQERIYFLFSHQSAFFPGRMSTNAENAILKMLWDWAAPNCKIGMASTNSLHWSGGSENHHAQGWVSFWGAAQIFKNHPDYQNRTYADGTTPAQMAAAFDKYFKAYVRERALKGLTVEIASPTYAKYTLNTWYNLADFATDPDLKSGAGMLIDLYWADWAVEQIDGVRGGSRHRCYTGSPSIEESGGSQHAWYFFGLGTPLSRHPGSMGAMTTFWRPSRATVGLALDVEGRGSYGYTSRRLGLRDKTPPPAPPALGTLFDYNALDGEGGSLLRYTWCTPDFVMGMSQVASLPTDDWIDFSSQNRWNGVVFGGHATARIFTQRPQPAAGSVYNEEWGVQNKGVMILQRLPQAESATGQMVWFDFSLNRQEANGWVFAEAPQAYAAVRIVTGGGFWKPDSTNQQRDTTSTNIGEWLVLTNQFSPIIMEVARKQDYAGFDAFKAEISANPLTQNGSRLDYSSAGYQTTLTLFTNRIAPPRVDGVPLNFSPVSAYDCPYIQGDFSGGSVIINYGDDRTVLGVAPFIGDDGTLYHWNFETTFPGIHPDSTDSVGAITNGQFGGAFRCSYEAGDQYMMTASAWPDNQGTFRYQGWIRLNPADTGGELFHIYDQVYLSVDTSKVTFKINRSGITSDTSATNLVQLSASISTSNDWQYIEAVYDGARIKLATEMETVAALGIGTFVPNLRTVTVGSRKNKSNYVGDMDEVKISAAPVSPVVVGASAQRQQVSNPDISSNTLSGFAPMTGPGTKLVVCASWESPSNGIKSVTYAGEPFSEAVTSYAGRQSSIWYLDEPVSTSGNVVVTLNGPADSRIGVLSLMNAAAGAPDRTNAVVAAASIGLTTMVGGSLVVGVYTENGAGALSSDFENTIYSGDSGSSVGNAGYQAETIAGAKTYSWIATTNSCAAVVASFPPFSSSAQPIADDDADGMDDTWEVEQFGSIGFSNGTFDTDDDGFTDVQEFIAGTDPWDAGSRLEITGLVNGTNLTWKAVQGMSYRVLSSTSLVDGVWIEESSGIPGRFPEAGYSLTNDAQNLFLRIKTE